MEMKLVVATGKNAGKVLPIEGPKFVIGRAANCQLRPSSDLVGQQHCAILFEEGRVVVEDLGSQTGTLVNGQRISGQQELKSGDRLKIASLEFDVQLTVAVGGKKKPKIHNVQEAAARTVETTSSADEASITDWLSQPDPSAAPLESTQADAATFEELHNPLFGKKKAATTGKLFGDEANKKLTAPSSREAAADILKQMLKQQKK